jgi:pimeloyl-ACP methyl ester carboxylesterase
VQYFVPETATLPYPLVLLHGGGLSGTIWETTPDGRPGWLRQFLAAGIACFVVDGVERGRAGWPAIQWQELGPPVTRSEREFWSLCRIGAEADYTARRAFAGQRFPVERFEELVRHSMPRWPQLREAAVAAFVAALERIGPAAILCHSQGGDIAFAAAAARPDLVKAMLCIEASGLPAEGAMAAHRGRPHLFVLGDFLDALPIWRALTAGTRAAAAALGGDLWLLQERGLPGHSHMPMMDRGGEEVARRLVDWMKRVGAG